MREGDIESLLSLYDAEAVFLIGTAKKKKARKD